jgi:hypothetical protein
MERSLPSLKLGTHSINWFAMFLVSFESGNLTLTGGHGPQAARRSHVNGQYVNTGRMVADQA